MRQYRWGLSRWAKFFLFIVVLTLAVITFLNVHRFLAVTQRLDTDVLVVEGWVHPYAIRASAEEFQNHSYHRIFTTGGPVVGNGGYINDYQTAASVGADLLKKAEPIAPRLRSGIGCVRTTCRCVVSTSLPRVRTLEGLAYYSKKLLDQMLPSV